MTPAAGRVGGDRVAAVRARRAVAVLAVAALAAVPLAACGAPVQVVTRPLTVVASTDVYGELAREVAGPLAGHGVAISSIIASPSQDPHEFEPSAHTELAIARAAVVIENGGGYDDFVPRMLAAAGSPRTTVIDAVTVAGKRGPNLNEHVWYDLASVRRIVARLAAVFTRWDPRHGATYRRDAAALDTRLAGLQSTERTIRRAYGGASVLVTEPLPLYLLQACGLVNRTPAAFSQAIEQSGDIPVRVLAGMLDLVRSGAVRALVVNAQAASAETARLVAAAHAAHVPVVAMTETLPAHTDFPGWMRHNLTALRAALQRSAAT